MKTNEIQTILGAGGVIGNGLAQALNSHTNKIRLASRNPKPINSGDELIATDALKYDHLSRAVKGSSVVYLTIGLQYLSKIWRRDWPVVMENAVNACMEHQARLVFFDNVYLYGLVDGPMTEETPVNPCSHKGEVRAQIAAYLMDQAKKENIQALIARSADFYGPDATNTFVHPMVFQKLKEGKKASWLANDNVKHAMTHTPDAAKATALLGNTPLAYGQVWHLPTSAEALTGKEFIEKVAACYQAKPSYSVLSKWMMQMASWFNPLARESAEMLYQNTYEYLVSSKKFEQHFFEPTSYSEGIEITAASI
jgi:nucleoside-diphosphate-sugar epimerase